MKKYKKHISKALFFLIGLIILSFIGVLIHQTQEAKRHLFTEIPVCLQTSIKQTVEHKAKDAYYVAQYENGPNKRKIGEYETRTAKYVDTIFEYRSKIVDPETDVLRGLQTALLETNQLHADSIQFFFDNLLKERNIRVKSIIGITASSYKTNVNEWSGDTTAILVNYRTVLAKQGKYEHINYYAYIHYSPYAIWTLMPKKAIYILLICSIIWGVILSWWLHKRKKEKKNGIALLKNGNYRIRNMEYDIKEKTLIPEDPEKEVTFPPLLNNILLLFLEAEHHRVNKKNIKQKFWPKAANATTNMTSTINRLNTTLKETGCAYTVITAPKEEEYYIFCESD